ncbi:hypothetical protein [Alicyclobacillus fodiniaquatilis]|jgi:hypothetical protein|uniref:Uncharacterized protein n=1 Tax=Alicyclobacillus fodiniaquatilis TaxID=1661150 RepID=A0ABW4JLX4_9BACL
MHWLYFVVEICVVMVAVGTTLFVRQRRRQRMHDTDSPPPGFVLTDEVNIDPTTGIRQRVWYNPATGERVYVRER